MIYHQRIFGIIRFDLDIHWTSFTEKSAIRWEVSGCNSSCSIEDFINLCKFSVCLAAIGRKIISRIDQEKAGIATNNWLNKQKNILVGTKISNSVSLLDFKYYVFAFWGPPDDFDVNTLTIYFENF